MPDPGSRPDAGRRQLDSPRPRRHRRPRRPGCPSATSSHAPPGDRCRTRCWSPAASRRRAPGRRLRPAGRLLRAADPDGGGPARPGPDIDARGAAFPGVNLYVLLGRGQDFAWSATSAGQDIIDTFAEKLCEPDGGTPTVDSDHYLYKGDCLPIEVARPRNDIWTPNPGDPTPAGTYTLPAQRTVHGHRDRAGTVDGKPVAFTRLRSTYFHEADSALGFADFNEPVEGEQRAGLPAARRRRSASRSTGSTSTTSTSPTSTRATTRCAPQGADPDFPNWGTPKYDWQGFDPTCADLAPRPTTCSFAGPPAGHQPALHHVLEQQAGPGYDAADDNYAYGPKFRNQALDDRIKAGIRARRR